MRKTVCLFILILFTSLSCLYAHDIGNNQLYKPKNRAPRAGKDSGIVLIPFEFKQCALYHTFTYEVIDSVVNQLLKNDSITLSIYGYSHVDEGNDTVCKYLALNRALFVRDYVLGRGVDKSRLLLVKGMTRGKSLNSNLDKKGHALNYRVELTLNYPPPPPPIIYDRDGDGIKDSVDACADEFGYFANKGCPDKDPILVLFEIKQSYLSRFTYKTMDSVITVLKENPSFSLYIQGHAYKLEGVNSVCERLAIERATVIKKYLLSRNIAAARIVAVESFGNTRPLNAGKNPLEIFLNSRAQLFIKK
jgi:outer membrane protein OmpA-like peptidoglycan-associated protein